MESNAESNFVPTPHPSIESEDVIKTLDAAVSGLNYLQSIAPDDLGEPFPMAVCSFIESVLPLLEGVQEQLGTHPVILNPTHPQFKNLCLTIRKAGEAGESAHSTRERKLRVAKASPLLLVPRGPAQESHRSAAPVA